MVSVYVYGAHRRTCIEAYSASKASDGSVAARLDIAMSEIMSSLRFPLDGLMDADAWIMRFTRPKSTSAAEKARLKLPGSLDDVKVALMCWACISAYANPLCWRSQAMIAPLKLRSFETAMIARLHKVAARAIYTVSPGLLTSATFEQAVCVQLSAYVVMHCERCVWRTCSAHA